MAIFHLLKKLPLFILTLSFFTSCHKEELSPQNPMFGPRPTYDATAIGECSTSPTTGESPSQKPVLWTFVDSGFFGKEFRQLFFLQALKASSLDVVDWLYEEGVNIFKIETNSKSECRYFGFLNTAPQEYISIWETHGGQSNGKDERTLLGLFRTQLLRPSVGGPAQMRNPVILVRDDTNHWTLVHEKTHFLFAQGRLQKSNMAFIETLREDNRTLYRKLRGLEFEYIQEKQSIVAKQILKTFSDYLIVNQELFNRGPLEEFSIESLISTQVIENNSPGLNHITGLINALAYMKSNTDPVLTSYQTLVRKLKNYQEDFFKDEPQSTLDQAHDLQVSLQSKIDFIKEKVIYLQIHLEDIGEQKLDEPRQLLDHSHYDFEILLEQIDMIESLNLSHTSDTHNAFDFR